MLKTTLQGACAIAALAALPAPGQTLSNHWEDLTSPEVVQALQQSNQTCLLPFGVVEKHGPSGN